MAAHDEERWGIERNIHDGAQQQLVALGIQLGLAHRSAEREAPKIAETLEGLQTQATDVLENLRDLARGIYPPLLADQGLLVALEAQTGKAAIPVEVEGARICRYPAGGRGHGLLLYVLRRFRTLPSTRTPRPRAFGSQSKESDGADVGRRAASGDILRAPSRGTSDGPARGAGCSYDACNCPDRGVEALAGRRADARPRGEPGRGVGPVSRPPSAQRRWGRSAPWLAGAGVVLILTATVMEQAGLWGVPRGSEDGPFFSTMIVLAALSWGGAGALIGARRPENPISLVLAGEALLLGLISFSETYSKSDLPFTSVASSVFSDLPLIPLLLAVPLLLLLFPTGRPPSPRWRWVGWLLAASGVFGVLGLIVRGSDDVQGPVAVQVLLTASGFTGFAGATLALASVVVRFRRSRGEERAQMRWLFSVALLGAIVFVLALFAEGVLGEVSAAAQILQRVLLAILTVGLPASIGISILRYRLYELDVVIRKTVVFGILAVLITALSVGVLLLLSSPITDAVPSEGETAAVAVAMLVVGALVWPLWKLATRVADRVVFGGRASPYDVLTQFVERVGDTYSADDVLPRMAQVLGRATGAKLARVWLRVGDELRPEAAWPTDAPAPPSDPSGSDPATSYSAEVWHRGESLGALDVVMPANDPMNPSKERLVRDLAAQAGPVLRNVLLVEDLRESRRRIVTAQDERAKKLERDLHDGAQQQLVALGVKMRLLDGLLETDLARGHELVAQLQTDTTEALESLRDLARGIYPPLLADQGLPAALEAQVRRAAVPTVLDTDRIGRYGQDVESAVYFCTLEALNNVAKYAGDATTTITLSQEDGNLTFTVHDDGKGFDPARTPLGTGLQGMRDRLEALGGTFEIESSPGTGTTVHGTITAVARSDAR